MNSIATIVPRAPASVRQPGQADALFGLPLSMPLVLDLDGTLIAGDLLYKSFFSILRRNPLIVFRCALWLRHGRAALKRQLALRNRIDWDRLKLHQDVRRAGAARESRRPQDRARDRRRCRSRGAIGVASRLHRSRAGVRRRAEFEGLGKGFAADRQPFPPVSSMPATARPISRCGAAPAASSSSTRAAPSPKPRARWAGRCLNCRAGQERRHPPIQMQLQMSCNKIQYRASCCDGCARSRITA